MDVNINSEDRRTERRRRSDRYDIERPMAAGFRYPGWQEQRTQFFTRYVFLLLGVLFFNLIEGISPAYSSLTTLNIAFAVYFLLNTAMFMHARRNQLSPRRYYIAMWVDIVITSFCILNDPYPIPPSLLVFIMVVLGNGMRYGMRLFAVSLIGSFAATTQWALENNIDFSVTFGLGEAPLHGDNFTNLLERVDQALYHSKSEHTGGGLAYAKCP